MDGNGQTHLGMDAAQDVEGSGHVEDDVDIVTRRLIPESKLNWLDAI